MRQNDSLLGGCVAPRGLNFGHPRGRGGREPESQRVESREVRFYPGKGCGCWWPATLETEPCHQNVEEIWSHREVDTTRDRLILYAPGNN